jgi:IS4 transposase
MRGRGKGDNPAHVGRTLKVQEEETHILPGYRVDLPSNFKDIGKLTLFPLPL